MRKNVRKVIEAFKRGEAAIGDSKRTIWTDGTTIFSYSTAIAIRVPGEAGVAYAPDGHKYTRRTMGYDSYVRINPPIYTRTTNGQIRALMAEFNKPVPCTLHDVCRENPTIGQACAESTIILSKEIQ